MVRTGDLAGLLSEAVHRRGLTQAAAASLLGVSQQTLSRWMSGEVQPGPDKLAQLAAFLELPVDDLADLRGVRSRGTRANVARRMTDLETRTLELEGRLLHLTERLELLADRLDRPGAY